MGGIRAKHPAECMAYYAARVVKVTVLAKYCYFSGAGVTGRCAGANTLRWVFKLTAGCAVSGHQIAGKP
jgi:hypothetical protein